MRQKEAKIATLISRKCFCVKHSTNRQRRPSLCLDYFPVKSLCLIPLSIPLLIPRLKPLFCDLLQFELQVITVRQQRDTRDVKARVCARQRSCLLQVQFVRHIFVVGSVSALTTVLVCFRVQSGVPAAEASCVKREFLNGGSASPNTDCFCNACPH